MKVELTKPYLPVYEALASEVRLNIIQLLAKRPMFNKELAAELGLSAAIMTMHIGKLEKAGLIHSRMERKNGGTYKICSLAIEGLEIVFPAEQQEKRQYHEVSIPIGHFTDFDVYPTCGIATEETMIGQYDDARYFFMPERMQAGILWFGRGFVEYKFPNYLFVSQRVEEIEISLELGSEAPGYNENWPSDIYFTLNGVQLGYWTSPGDFGAARGRLTPAWWNDEVNQYGMLKVIRINSQGTFLDGSLMSEVTAAQVQSSASSWSLRLEVPEQAVHVGGLTLFGRSFGNYEQDITVRVHYHEGEQRV